IGKLKFGDDEDWNHHRTDVAHLTAYVESKWKRDLTWQTVDFGAATVDDLVQSPVLYINGQRAPQFTDEQVQALREYVSRGGFILADACCDGGKEFDAGIREIFATAFPEPEYKLHLLDADHHVWHFEEPVAPEQARPLWGIDFG